MVSLTSLTQKQWIKAYKKLGFTVDAKKGKGSHCRVINPAGGFKPQTIPYHSNKFISLALYKTLLEWGCEEKDIDKALK